MSEALPIRAWSDFDGTAVKKYPKVVPMNWSKYPLPLVPGYNNFMWGVNQAGVELSGIVTRRPDIGQRQWATARSMSKLGIDQMFYHAGIQDVEVKHVGDEEKKGVFVAEQAREGVVVFIDDRPDKVGPYILEHLIDLSIDGEELNPLILAVAPHKKALDRIERFVDYGFHERIGPPSLDIREGSDGVSYNFSTGTASLTVMPIPRYSAGAGVVFGNYLNEVASGQSSYD